MSLLFHVVAGLVGFKIGRCPPIGQGRCPHLISYFMPVLQSAGTKHWLTWKLHYVRRAYHFDVETVRNCTPLTGLSLPKVMLDWFQLLSWVWIVFFIVFTFFSINIDFTWDGRFSLPVWFSAPKACWCGTCVAKRRQLGPGCEQFPNLVEWFCSAYPHPYQPHISPISTYINPIFQFGWST